MTTQHSDFYCVSLENNKSIQHWRLSSISSRRYDVDDTPMEGEMDPFFFLSKHKNFIPHTYPCRTTFQQTHVGVKPLIFGDTTMKSWWFPFGSERIDLSGFWFRPTQIAAKAETMLLAKKGGDYKFRLTTCGGAIVNVNGVDIAWNAEYQRNLETQLEFTVELQEGLNPISIWFDDLAERDIRFFFQLEFIQGDPLEVVLDTIVDGALARQMEQLLEGMSFDQSAYTEGTIKLCYPFPVPETFELNVKVIGDFISLDKPVSLTTTIAKGESETELAPCESLPADFRNFAISLHRDEFHITRTLGVEICHLAQQREIGSSVNERIDEALNYVATHGEYSSVKALARLACGLNDSLTQELLEGVLHSVDDCHDCADFTLVPLLWCRIAWPDDISESVREKIDRAILHFRYWMDEPGNDVQWYFSENHALLFHTATYLAGNLFPEKTFIRSGRKGHEQAAVGRDRVLAWLDHFEECEMAEWNSAPYFPIDLKGLSALAGLAKDPDIAARSQRAIARLLVQIAHSAHQGTLTASQGRSYEYTLRAGRTLELSAISRLIWGKGNYGCRFHALPQLALLLKQQKLTVDPGLADIAVWQKDTAQEWCFAQGANRIARLYHYKTRDIAMGSIAAYRWGEWGYQETPIHLRIGYCPEAQIWINHPGETLYGGFGRPSYWGGCGTLPRVQQYRGLALVIFDTHDGQPDFTHAFLPQKQFNEVRFSEQRILLRGDEGFAQISGNVPLRVVTTGPAKDCEVRLYGRHTCWLIRLNDNPQLRTLDDFDARFADLCVDELDNQTLRVNDPQYGEVLFRSDGSVQAEGRLTDPNTWTVHGESQELTL